MLQDVDPCPFLCIQAARRFREEGAKLGEAKREAPPLKICRILLLRTAFFGEAMLQCMKASGDRAEVGPDSINWQLTKICFDDLTVLPGKDWEHESTWQLWVPHSRMQVVAQAKDILRSANEDYQKDSFASSCLACIAFFFPNMDMEILSRPLGHENI